MKKKNKKKIFLKFINPKGHNGFKYKLGINTDPSPIHLSMVGSCEAGALYFSDVKNILQFRSYGKMIAQVEPVGAYVKDGTNKYKAKSINVISMVPRSWSVLEKFGVDISPVAISSYDIPLGDSPSPKLEVNYILYRQNTKGWNRLLQLYRKHPKFRTFITERLGNMSYFTLKKVISATGVEMLGLEDCVFFCRECDLVSNRLQIQKATIKKFGLNAFLKAL